MKRSNKDQDKALPHASYEDAAYLKHIADSCPSIIYVLDLQRREFTYLNSRVRDLVGVDEMYVFMRGENIFRDVVHPEDYQRRMQQIDSITSMKDEEIKEIEIRVKVDGKGYRWFRVTDRVFKRNEKGEAIEAIGTAHDIHESRLMIDNLDKQIKNKNRQLEALNSELKTFNSIATNDYSETLRNLYTSLEYIVSHDASNLSNTGRANIRRAQASIQKMKLLTEDIISYTKLHEIDTQDQVVDLNTVLSDVLYDFGKKPEQYNATINADPLPKVNGFPLLISLVFHHLIDNAIRFGKDTVAPLIRISANESVKGDQVKHEAAQPHIKYHVIVVTDNGIGFLQEDAKRIFEMFSRLNNHTRHKGSGIGLAVCKKIMGLLGGFISAESEPGKGSAFYCYFPADKGN
jgi:PAS domain S-box-containing protein